jgi:hypothetical protein
MHELGKMTGRSEGAEQNMLCDEMHVFMLEIV